MPLAHDLIATEHHVYSRHITPSLLLQTSFSVHPHPIFSCSHLTPRLWHWASNQQMCSPPLLCTD